MMRRLAVVVGAIVACRGAASSEAAPPAPQESASVATAESVALPAVSAPTVSARPARSAAPIASAAPSATVDPAFLPIDVRCSADADCAVSTLALEKETYECCSWCKPTVASKRWVKRAQAICDAKARAGFRPQCAPWDCAAPPEAACVRGVCAFTP